MSVLIILYLTLCLAVGFLGKHTSVGFWANFIFAIFFTPVLPLIFILIVGHQKKKIE
jgi:hypothetical protein